MNILAVYPGRFQPFHKGHGKVYKWLKSKFGNATIATSNKVEAPKSPFNFEEKKKMMTLAGVTPSDVQQVANPYIAREILRQHDPKTTVLVFAVSEKDMQEDPRFSFKPTRSGKPGYLQPFPKDGKNLEPFGDPERPKGYVIVTPTFQFEVLGEPMKSATELRKQFANADHETQKKIIKDLFGKYDSSVHKLMDEKIKAMVKEAKSFTTLRNQLNEEITHKDFGPMLDSFVSFASDELGLESLPNIKYQSQKDTDRSFGGYNPSTNELVIATMNRHPMDIFRTIAHELVHHKQNGEGRIKNVAKEGADGSDIENEANATAGKIMRAFGRNNPNMFKKSPLVEEVLDEGIYDPSTLKAVFIAGGPGSGKDYILKQTMMGHGLTEINSDNAFEYLLGKEGLDPKMPESEKELREPVRGRSKVSTKKKQRLNLIGRKGIIINGTGDDVEKYARLKKKLELLGYDTMMVFVNTSNEVSKQRNIDRGAGGGREVPEKIRQQKWDDAQASRPAYEEMFGKDKFVAIDNSIDARKAGPEVAAAIQAKLDMVWKMIRKFTTSPPKENQATQKWTSKQMAQTGATQLQKPNVAASISRPSRVTPASADDMAQAAALGLTYYGFGRFGKNINGKNVVTHTVQNGKLVPKQRPMAEAFVPGGPAPTQGQIAMNVRQKNPTVGANPTLPGAGARSPVNRMADTARSFNRLNRATPSIQKAIGESEETIGEDLRKWFKEKWVRMDTKGNIKGDCAREPGEGKPKCLPMEKAKSMSKSERAKSARRKRREDPVADRSGKGEKPVNVQTESYITEKNVPTNPELWARAKSMAKQKFDVYPSAYANGWASKWYKSKGGGWKSVNEAEEDIPMSKKRKPKRNMISDIDEAFDAFINTPSNREWGKTSTVEIYSKGTPGQWNTKPPEKKKKKLKEAQPALGYEFGNNGLGPTYGITNSPSLMGGYALGVTIPMNEQSQKKNIGEFRDMVNLMGTVPNQGKEEVEEEKDPRLVRAGVEGFNKPKRTPGHPTKSHIVVAKVGDIIKTIRFGQQGAETAGAPKEGESDRMKAKRKSFKSRHSRNIARGPISAAYWADKVKWEE